MSKLKAFFVDENGKVRKMRVVIAFLACLFLIAIAANPTATKISGSPATPTSTNAPENPAQQEEEKVYKIGQQACAGKLCYTITDVEEKKELKNALGSKKPGSGTFVILAVTIENKDNEGRSVTEAMTKLVDKEGNEYEPSADAFMYLDVSEHNGNSALFDNINPKGKKEFKIVYDVAGKAEDYTFVANGGFDVADNGEVKIQLKK